MAAWAVMVGKYSVRSWVKHAWHMMLCRRFDDVIFLIEIHIAVRALDRGSGDQANLVVQSARGGWG